MAVHSVRPILFSVAVAAIGFSLLGCSYPSNTLEVREREGELIPPGLFEIAPAVSAPIYPLHLEVSGDSLVASGKAGATGTLLPNGELLTASHIFKEQIRPAPAGTLPTVYPFLVDDKLALLSPTRFSPVSAANGDWVLLTSVSSKLLTSSPALSKGVRFDGSKPIARGTPLYCIGYPRTPDTYPGVTGFPRALTIVQGYAPRDFGPGEEVTAESETDIDLRGMSGGPVGTYNHFTGVFTVIGTATKGTINFRLFNAKLISPFFTCSRIAPEVMERLSVAPPIEQAADTQPPAPSE